MQAKGMSKPREAPNMFTSSTGHYDYSLGRQLSTVGISALSGISIIKIEAIWYMHELVLEAIGVGEHRIVARSYPYSTGGVYVRTCTLLTDSDKVLLTAILLFVWLSAYDTTLMVLDELTGRVVPLEARPLWAATLPPLASKVKP